MRVCRVDLGGGPPASTSSTARRTRHAATRAACSGGNGTGSLAELDAGLERALGDGPGRVDRRSTRGASTTGCSTRDGELVEPPVSYRDERTRSDTARSSSGSARARLYELTGLQFLPFNTIFQLAAHDPAQLARRRARRDAPRAPRGASHRRGRRPRPRAREPPGCSTSPPGTGPTSCATRSRSPARCCPRSSRPGTGVGSWRGVPVHLVGGHDTASAVLGGARAGEAFVSAGTWLLVGREQPDPDTSVAAYTAGFSNEQGAMGGLRLLRNIAGWWLVEECRRTWADDDLDHLLADAAAAPNPGVLVDATDERFLAPPDMERELGARRNWARRRAAPLWCAPRSSRWRPRPPGSSSRCRSTMGVDRSRSPGLRRRLAVAALPRRAPPAHRTAGLHRPGRGHGRRERAGPGCRIGCLRRRARSAGDPGRPAGSRAMNVQALERLELMRHRLDTEGRVRVQELADELDVSEMTIRRDLDMLVDEGVAQRVRGGAVAVGPQQFATRFRQHSARPRRASPRSWSTWSARVAPSASTPRRRLQRLAARLGGVARSHRAHQRTRHVPRPAGASPGSPRCSPAASSTTRTGSLVGPLATPRRAAT